MTLTISVAFKPLRYSTVFLATLCILFGQSIDVAGELVARWEFNEGKGNTVKDSSGKGHDGTFAGGDPQWVPGISGSALAFDGDDYVAIDAWITETGAADFTITAWIKTTKTSVSFLTKNNEDRSLDFMKNCFTWEIRRLQKAVRPEPSNGSVIAATGYEAIQMFRTVSGIMLP